jgi:transposase
MDPARIFLHAEEVISASEKIDRESPPMPVTTVGIDLAKHVFHLYGEDARGKAVLRKRLSRAALKPFLATLPPCRVGMEACGGAHYWAREFRQLGH